MAVFTLVSFRLMTVVQMLLLWHAVKPSLVTLVDRLLLEVTTLVVLVVLVFGTPLTMIMQSN